MESVKDTEIHIKWEFGFSSDEFSVEYRPVNGTWTLRENANQNQPFFKIKQLEPNTIYEILIRAVVYDVAGGDYCDTVTQMTCPDGTEGFDCTGGEYRFKISLKLSIWGHLFSSFEIEQTRTKTGFDNLRG